MKKRFNEDDYEEDLEGLDYDKNDTKYLDWLERYRDELDREWSETNQNNSDKESDVDYVTYIVDKFIEWLGRRS